MNNDHSLLQIGLVLLLLFWILQRAKLDSEVAPTAVDLIFDVRKTSTKLTESVNHRTQLFDDHDLAKPDSGFSRRVGSDG
jgi:hypothetical protein